MRLSSLSPNDAYLRFVTRNGFAHYAKSSYTQLTNDVYARAKELGLNENSIANNFDLDETANSNNPQNPLKEIKTPTRDQSSGWSIGQIQKYWWVGAIAVIGGIYLATSSKNTSKKSK